MQEFDLIVIGSGPAGYTGAIRASQLGMKVACVEKRATDGGTCLNVGCIPSKALLNFSEKYAQSRHHFADIGIETNSKLNLKKMMAKKEQIVSELCKGINGLFAKNKITRLTGAGRIIEPHIVEVYGENDQKIRYRAKNILIATGSVSSQLANINIDEKQIISSTGALSLSTVPKNLIVIGGGVIGLELGSVWNRLGSTVTIIEFADRIVPSLDQEISKNFRKILEKQGIIFKLGHKVTKATAQDKQVALTINNIAGDAEMDLTCDKLLVAIGRQANSKNLGLAELGIVTDQRGRIEVNESFQTNIENIYAVGDVIIGDMLAHKAEEEAIAAVEVMAGQAGHVNHHLIAGVIYTSPEVASVGYTEEQLKEKKIAYKIGKFPFLANSRARSVMSTDGLVKILACAESDKLLGAHIIGADAGTMIAELVAFMEFGAAAEDVARTCHAHPTLNEAVKEAALAVAGRTINI